MRKKATETEALVRQRITSFRRSFNDKNVLRYAILQSKLPLPKDPDEKNYGRAGWAMTAVEAFIGETRTDPQDAVADLISGLAHFCDRLGINLSEEIASACLHYSEEAPDGKQFDGIDNGTR